MSAHARTALVTGASRGIGAAIAERLAAEGCEVALVARSLDSHPHLAGTLRETSERIRSRGGRAIPLQADLSDPLARRRLIEEALGRLGHIDILVNNAAAAYYMPFERFSEKRLRIAFELNVRAPFELAQQVVPEMRQRGRGWILNVSSSAAVHPTGPPFESWSANSGELVHAMTKAALERFTTGLAAELHGSGIAVNALSPMAAVHTPGAAALGVIPADRPDLFEPVELIAEAALALCSGDPGTLTGRLARTGPLLRELGRVVRTIDGSRELVLDPA